MILDEVKEAYVKDLMAHGRRADGRQMLQYRPIKVEKSVYSNCEGSAIAFVGDTKVLAGVKVDAVEPFSDRPGEGVLSVNAEFAPLAHPGFTAGPPNEDSIELARVVDRGIRAAGTIDLAKLALPDGKVWGVFVDLYVLDHCGNLTDAAALAAMAALSCTKLPSYSPGNSESEGVVDRENRVSPLPLLNKVLTVTFEKISGKIVVDATEEEEVASDGRLTIAVCDGQFMVAGQKSGRAGFSKREMMELLDIALGKFGELAVLV
ncbi:MAG: exosome complex protein Rrp42 [Candidatus Micrarchaeia archaeon]